MPSSDYTPDVADVALFLRTRTRDTNGVELGTFTDATRPTGTEVSDIIADTVVNMEDDIGVDIDSRLWSSAKRVTALRAAMAIEVSYFSEQVASNRSVYPQLKEWYEEDLDKLNVAIVETAEGGEPGSDAGEDTPVWGGGDLPFPDGLSPSGVDLRLGSTWPEAIGAFHNENDLNEVSIANVLGSREDVAPVTPATGSIAGYLRKIRDLLSGTLNVNVVSGGGGGGGPTDGLTDVELRATPVPVTGPATDAQLRATPIPVSHSGLTDDQLRATRVPVDPGAGPFPVSASALPLPTGAATEATLASLASTSGSPGDAAWVSGNGTVIALLKKIASSGAASGLTDAQLRATPVPVDTGVVHVIIDSGGGGGGGGLTDTELRATPVPVDTGVVHVIIDSGGGGGGGGLTDTELRATAVAVSVASLPLPSGAATSANQASILAGIGAPSDAAATTTGSLIAQARRIANLLAGTLTVSGTVAVSGTVPVSGPLTDTQLRASAVPISVASLPLPTGAATETSAGLAATALGAPADAAATTTGSVIAQLRRVANLLAGTLTVSGTVGISGSVAVTGPLTDTQLRASSVPVSGPITDAQIRATALPVSGTFWQATQPVSLASQPLPTGASTETTLASVLTGVGAPADAAATTTGSIIAQLRRVANLLAGTLTVSGTVAVSGSVAVTGTFWQATQPVSGTFWQATQPVSAASLPLPTGAALDATLTGGTQQAINRGGAKGATAAATVTSTASGADHQGLDAVLYDASGNRLGSSGTPLRTDPTGVTTQPISAASLPLPAGAATETTLAAANTAIGTTADAASSTTGTVIAHLRKIRDLLAATLTVSVSGSVAVTGTFWQATQPVSIAATVAVDSELTTADLDTGAGTDTRAVVGLVIAKSGGAANLSATDPMPVSGTFWQATQPVSAASLPLPAGAATETSVALSATALGAPADAAATTTGSVIAQLRRIANELAGNLAVTGTFWQATQPVSLASQPLPTGASTETTLASLLTTAGATGDAAATGAGTLNAHLRSIAAALAGTLTVTGGGGGTQFAEDAAHTSGDLGTMALGVRKDTAAALATTDGDYMPMIFDASGRLHVNPSGVTQPVSGTFWQATQPVSAASLPLPSGASTETTLASMNTAMGRTKVTTDAGTKDWQHIVEGFLTAGVPTAVDAAHPIPVVQTGTPGLPTGASTETTLASLLTSIGATADAASSTTGSLNAHLRSIAAALAGTLTVAAHAVTNAGTFAVQDSEKLVDNAAFTDGTTKVLPAGYIFDDVAGTALSENDIAAPRIDSKRATVAILEGLTRGTRAEVKAASTAAVAGDPALVVALSPNQNTIANALYVRPRQMSTYGAGYRLAAATAGVTYLGLTFAVNTDKQLATMYHAASATKTVRVKRITVWLHLAAAGTFQFEARRLSATTAPATGNPAITPGAYDSSDAAAETTCLALPTTQGSETAANSPLTPNYTWNAASSTAETSGAIAAHELLLFDARGGMPSGKEITLRAGVAEGIAIIGRSLTAVALNFTAYIEFTEE